MFTKLALSLNNKNLISEEILTTFENLSDYKVMKSLLQNSYVSIEALSEVLKNDYLINSCDLSTLSSCIGENAINLISHTVVTKYNILPISISDNELILAMANPFDYDALDDIYIITKLPVSPVFVSPKDITFLINKYYSSSKLNTIASQFLDETKPNEIDLHENNNEMLNEFRNSPAVNLTESLINSALLREASDIHIEPMEDMVRVRFRIDGTLLEVQSFDLSLLPYVVSRLKIMGKMDISEKRLPQDGHVKLKLNNINADLRLSTIPTVNGEKIVIRLVYNQLHKLDKNNLGFFEEDLIKISNIFKSPHGAILVTGPTGSGKTTTLATFLNELNNDGVNIITVEDPVENQISGINQISINTSFGLDFANILRNILRQDPDIIMIGEIRDTETAKIAIQSSLTGHLVLSTLHTNDALSTITRLVHMGIEPFLVTASIKAVISQRLVRRLCPFCKIETYISETDAKILKVAINSKIYEKNGCSQCNNTGYKGRFAIYEYLLMDNELKNLIENEVSTDKIYLYLKSKGMNSLWDNALKNVLLGNTSTFEMYKAVFEF